MPSSYSRFAFPRSTFRHRVCLSIFVDSFDFLDVRFCLLIAFENLPQNSQLSLLTSCLRQVVLEMTLLSDRAYVNFAF